jgi:hypothetical protein
MLIGEIVSELQCISPNPMRRVVDHDMTMRYHWGLAVGHLYTHTLSRQHDAPNSTNHEFEGRRHERDTVEHGVNGDNGSPDNNEGEIPAPISTNPELPGLRQDLDTAEQGANGSSDKDEGEIPDTASDVHDRDHWDREGRDNLDHEGRYHWDDKGSDENSECDSDSDSHRSHTDSETESVLLETGAMYGDTLDVEWTSFD